MKGKKSVKRQPRKKKAKQLKITGTTASKKRKQQTLSKKQAGIRPFPIVGIGGSAGGLEAFSTMLEHLPSTLGMAYVYIQHLSPNHESFLTRYCSERQRCRC